MCHRRVWDANQAQQDQILTSTISQTGHLLGRTLLVRKRIPKSEGHASVRHESVRPDTVRVPLPLKQSRPLCNHWTSCMLTSVQLPVRAQSGSPTASQLLKIFDCHRSLTGGTCNRHRQNTCRWDTALHFTPHIRQIVYRHPCDLSNGIPA